MRNEIFAAGVALLTGLLATAAHAQCRQHPLPLIVGRRTRSLWV